VIACKRKRFAEAIPLLKKAQTLGALAGAAPARPETTAEVSRASAASPDTAPATADDIGVELPDGGMAVLVHKNTGCPTAEPIVRVFRLGNDFPWPETNRRHIKITLRQGSQDRAEQNARLGVVPVDLPPNLPTGTRLSLSISLEDDGIVDATAQLDDYPGWQVSARMESRVAVRAAAPQHREEPSAQPGPAQAQPESWLDEVGYYLGLAHAQEEQWPEAIAVWSELAGRCPDDAALQLDLARCQYQLGRRHFAANDFAAAADAWKRCARTMQDDALYTALAEAYFRRGTELLAPAAHGESVPDEALTALSNAGEIEGRDSTRILTSTALVALAAGQSQLAVQQLRALYARDPHDARATYHLGFALRQAGQDGEARQFLEEALRAPGTPLPPRLRMGACLILAEIHAAAERWHEAAQMYTAAFADAIPVTEPAPAREGIA
jgi:Flp pilus assembly protein TadD